jgi:hypothetical protein
MTKHVRNYGKIAVAWFAAGAGWDIQGRVLDHFLDDWFSHVTWLAWLQ